MYTHILDTKKHAYFLGQERTDPITGEHLQEGDEVVLCGICQSAFLRDSWEYIGGRHCGSVGTLKDIPEAREVRIKPSDEIGEVWFKSPLFRRDKRDLITHVSGLFYPATLLIKHLIGKEHWLSAFIIFFMFGTLLTLLTRFGYRKFTERIATFRDRGLDLSCNIGLNLGKKKRKLRYRDIESIRFVAGGLSRKDILIKDKAYVRLIIKMKSGECIETNFANKKDGRSALLFTLFQLQEQVKVSFDLRDAKLQTLLEERQNARLRVHQQSSER